MRNDDGDEVVDPPEEWIDAGENESLDERLAEETPDVSPADIDPRDADDTEAAVGPADLQTTNSTASIRSSTGANAARSTGRRRTANRSSTSSSE